MAGANPAKRVALDSNVLLSLARGVDTTHEFRQRFQARRYVLHAPPTVLRELQWLQNYGTPDERALAQIALRQMPAWRLEPFAIEQKHETIPAEFARRLINNHLLPPEERNDGRILAETALGQIPVLATRDHHLLDIDEAALTLAFSEAGLPTVRAAHPTDLLRALRATF